MIRIGHILHIANFERYFSYARRSEEIRVIFNNTLDTLHSVEHAAGIDMEEILLPDNMLITGAH